MAVDPFKITNYEQLQDALLDWALPGGAEDGFRSNRGNFIRFAENRFDNELRVQYMIGTSKVASSQGLVSVPGDWVETIKLSILDASGRWLPMKSLTLDQSSYRWQPSQPAGYAMMDGAIRVIPIPNGEQNYELVYYRQLSKLSDVISTNWVLQRFPNLYLFASLAAAEAYLRNNEDLPLWSQSASSIIDTLNQQTIRGEFARGDPLVRQLTFG